MDDIIIFSKTPQEHLSHIRLVFEKLKAANLSMKKSKCNFFLKGNTISGAHPQRYRYLTTTFQNTCHPAQESTNDPKTSQEPS